MKESFKISSKSHRIFSINIHKLQTSQAVWMPSNLTYRNIPGIPNLNYIWSGVNSFSLGPFCFMYNPRKNSPLPIRYEAGWADKVDHKQWWQYLQMSYTRLKRREKVVPHKLYTNNWHLLILSAKQKFILRSALFWVVKQCIVLNPYRRFGTIYQSHIQGSRNPKRTDVLTWNIGEDLPLCDI
jgi:hypothetical protein